MPVILRRETVKFARSIRPALEVAMVLMSRFQATCGYEGLTVYFGDQEITVFEPDQLAGALEGRPEVEGFRLPFITGTTRVLLQTSPPFAPGEPAKVSVEARGEDEAAVNGILTVAVDMLKERATVGLPASSASSMTARPTAAGAKSTLQADQSFWSKTLLAAISSLVVLAVSAGATAIWRALVRQPWWPFAATALVSGVVVGGGVWLVARRR